MTTVKLQKVVWVEIKGDSRGELRARDDKGLSIRFLNFCQKHEIYSITRGVGYGGAGSHGGGYSIEHLELFEEFFKLEGITPEIE